MLDPELFSFLQRGDDNDDHNKQGKETQWDDAVRTHAHTHVIQVCHDTTRHRHELEACVRLSYQKQN